eukprot:TRINITY_DN2643_c0_g1_i2.p1 TRINITY_DN2643_c0_g1~~TRINITY_DN2643_c0_g1_i2.p1  ORF type:complete len:509 (+),score=141.77 TRINITY_DN2643_c0_g1_i2:669-2195(+)
MCVGRIVELSVGVISGDAAPPCHELRPVRVARVRDPRRPASALSLLLRPGWREQGMNTPPVPARAAEAAMRSRWLFFVLFMPLGFQGRFMSLFYQERGLRDDEIGAVLAVSAFVSIFAAPVWAGWADTYKNSDSKELLLMAAVVGAEAAFLTQALVDIGTVLPQYNFIFLLATRAVASLFFAAIGPLLNAVCVQDLYIRYGKLGSRRFGDERLYGAWSWLLVHAAQGWYLDRYGTWVMYCGHLGSSVLAVATLVYWRRSKLRSADDLKVLMAQHPEGTVCCGAVDRGVFHTMVLRNYLHIAFYVLMFVSAAGMSVVENLLFLFFRNDLQASYTMCGASVAITVVFEIPLFSFASDLLGKYGTSWMMAVGTAAYIIRVWIYTLVPAGWYVLLVEPLHGVTIALMTIGANEFIVEHAPRGRVTSAQGILAAVRTGAGFFTGTVLGGEMIQHFGENAMYRVYAVAVALALGLYIHASATSPSEDDEGEMIPLDPKSPLWETEKTLSGDKLA